MSSGSRWQIRIVRPNRRQYYEFMMIKIELKKNLNEAFENSTLYFQD